ncbi:MAG: hypothetical protein K6G87_00050 [Butyrivibrio sp.]|nr:hypothetical protein [Butyrivibrio sp.]
MILPGIATIYQKCFDHNCRSNDLPETFGFKGMF